MDKSVRELIYYRSKMSDRRFNDEEKKLILHRWFYALVGIITMIPTILLTFGQIQNITKENKGLAFYLLLLFHSGCVIFSIISSALFCRVVDALLTTLMIIFLSMDVGMHFYIRFLLDYHHLKEDFTIMTLRLGFVIIMLIILLPWTNIMTHFYQKNVKKENPICSRETTFSWILNLDTILMISLLILNIRSQAGFDRHQLLILSIGIPLIFLWLIIGKILVQKYSHHWTLWILFYILSFIQICHFVYLTYWSKLEYNFLSKSTEPSLICLLILTFLYASTNILIHFLLLLLISFCLSCR